jgi:hypothetical protein
MASTIITRPAVHFGAGTLAAALAGFIGLALAIAVAASMFFNPSLGSFDSQAVYPDYALRHPAVNIAPAEQYPDKGLRERPAIAPPGELGQRASDQLSDIRLADYGLRCLEVGWCTTPGSNGQR